MSTVGSNESTTKMPTGSSRRKARVPHHITRQPLVVEDEVIVSDIEDAMDIDPSSFDPGTPSTSSEAVCNGAGTGDDSTREEEEVKDKEEPVLPEGTVIVQPEAVPDNESDFEGPEFKSKLRTRRMAQKVESDIEKAHCTSCHKQVNHLDARTFKPHPILKVILCRRCFDYYKSGTFSQDDEGIDEQCRWCAEGGSLICCDFCTNAFCKKCIKHNLGRSFLSALMSSEDTKWRCFACDHKPLQELRMKCKSALEGLNKMAEQKPSKSRRRQTGDGREADEADDYSGTLHPSISKVSVNLQFKPNKPTLEISSDGLRILRPKEGDRWGLKMALWIMRSLKRTTAKAEKEINLRLAAQSDKDTKRGTVQLDMSSKWMEIKLDKKAKKTHSQHNGQTSHDSKPKLNQSKPSSSEETVRKQKDTPKNRRSNRNNETDDQSEDVTESLEESAECEEVKNKLDEEENPQSASSEQEMETEETNQNVETQEHEKDDDQQLDKSTEIETPCKNIEEKDGKSKSKKSDTKETDSDKAEDEEDLGDGEADEEEDKEKAGKVIEEEIAEGGEVESEVDKEDRSDQDIECEKALMEEIDGLGSDQSGEDEMSTPKKETTINSPFKITPLRIKIEKISIPKIAKSKEDKSKSPRRQKTTPKSPRNVSQKHSSDSSDLDQGIASDPEQDEKKEESSKTKVSKELFENKEDVDENKEDEDENKEDEDKEGSSDLTQSSDDDDSSSSKGSDWKAPPRRSARRQKEEGEEDKVKDKKKKKKSKKEKKKNRKNPDEESSSEVDFPKTPDLKKKGERKGPGLDSSNPEDDDSDEVERLITPRKSKQTPKGSKRLKVMRKSASKSAGKSKAKVRDSDSSNFDSDLERQIKTLSKAPAGKKKTKDDDNEEQESTPEDSDSLKDSDNVESKKPKEKATSKKSKSAKSKKVSDSDSNSDAEEEDSEKDGDQSGDDVQLLENISDSDLGHLEDGGHEGGEDIDSDLENKLAEKQLMEEIEAELNKGDSEEDEDDEGTSEDSEKPKGKRKKKTQDKDSGDEFDAESEEEDESESDSGEEESSSDEKSSKKKKHGRRHHLMRVKLGESSSEGSDEDASGSDSRKKKMKKRKRGRANPSSENDSDQGRPKKGGKRGRARKRSSSNSDEDSNDFQKERSYNRGKGKKRRRIKVATDSETDDQKVKGSGDESDAEKDTPSKHGRKKIRRVISKGKLQEETVRAAKEEKERRKRIADKRKMVTKISEQAAEEMGTVDEVILEHNSETKKPTLAVEKSLAKQLKPHQVEGVQFMWDCTYESLEKADEKGSGCILAHCMGLGKTLQVITYLHTIMNNPKINAKSCLVVAPLNTVLNWVSEFEKWLGEDSDIEVFEITVFKSNWQRADALKHWHDYGGVMVMGYTMYRQLALHKFCKNKKQRNIFTKTLADPGPDIVVCDEGHMLKNDTTAISKALNAIKTLRRICLTGTPLQNNLIEYHCMVDFVKPNLLGTRKEFLNRFVNPITNGQCADSTQRDVKIMKRRAHVLHDLLNGCVQRKDYSALTKFLPPKYEYVVSVRLSPVQIKMYELYLQSQSRNDSGELMEGSAKGSGCGLFADYQQLMRIWTHPHVLKLNEIRQEKIQARNYMSDFVTSASEDEMSDSNDSIQQFVVEGSDVEEIVIDSDEPTTSCGTTRRTRGMVQQAVKEEKDAAGETSEKKKKSGKDSGDSDSSMEIIKTWKTRSRCLDPNGENVTRSPSPVQTAKPKWYDEFIQEGDETKIELSGKLVLLFEVLKHAESIGEKVLVFSQSLLSLDLIEDMLQSLEDRAQQEREEGSQDLDKQIGGIGSWVKGEDYFRMDGSTSAAFRKTWAETFNKVKNYRARLFLISTKAGSLGTNLIGANRVIIFDASWNPSHDIQSIFRVYRFGQTRAVYIYRFVAQGSMEEKIYERQVTKQSLSCRVVDEHQIERHFTAADLSDLYTFTPDRLDDPNKPERETPVLPKDYVLAELLKHSGNWIVKYHEHDSLLENIESEELNEEERKNAWKEYEDEKEGRMRMALDPRLLLNQGINQQELAKLQGLYGADGQNAMQGLLSNQQQQQYSLPVINMMGGAGADSGTMMQRLALQAASSSGNYQQIQQQLMYHSRMQQMQQQIQQQQQRQQLQRQQQQQQQQQITSRSLSEMIAQSLRGSRPAAQQHAAIISKPNDLSVKNIFKTTVGPEGVKIVKSDNTKGEQKGSSGAWGGVGKGTDKPGPSS
ncbi:transcriptional regulator ATRX homolog isoform X2 [Asterias rubens]|uniref:transcriptional regulator ATRX homolog isoform X2 n=1 Tax=Asterias rubens TaxID=7604 RepID=UPI0014559DA4|nr:transcriptional regulator ATRX homolog isoform X2 [Asterias rubens]